MVCEMLGLAMSSLYYTAREREEAELVQAIEEIASRYPRYGSRRISKQLAREPYFMRVNRKRVQRIMRERGLVVLIKRSKKRTTDSRHGFARYPNLVLGLKTTRPNEVWVCDITYIRLGNSEFVYLAIVMDVFTRSIRGWNLSRSLAVEISVSALEEALSKAICDIHHSDQGIQYACPTYVQKLKEAGIQISMAEVGESNQNGFAERVIRTIKEEEVYLSDYQSFEEANERIGEFIDSVYNQKRIHSSLGYLTPSEFEEKWQEEQTRLAQTNGQNSGG
jgi:transposase InsO family protein